jgi:hypothetical protein
MLDVVGFALCAGAALAVATYKGERVRGVTNDGHKEAFAGEGRDLMVQWLKQCESACKAFSDTIEKGREHLQELIDEEETSERKVSPPATTAPEHMTDRNQKRRHKDDSRSDHYAEIEKLGDSGLDVERISRKAKVPKGEVELVLKLKKMGASTRVVV